jgi:predicted DNA-binding antitoxin AbrB/MazE fold protein
MSAIVRAVYEQGVLRPLHPLDLREQQRVRIQIWLEEASEEEEITRLLVSAGLMRSQPRRDPPPPPLSDEERRALADRIGRAPGKPVSEIVIEERGEW